MTVAQRGVSFSVGNNSAIYTLDRWNAYERGDAAITVSQESNGPSGFTKSLKALVTAADASLADPDRAYIEQKVEGQNSSRLAFGSADAKTVNISFWVKSNVTSSHHSFVLTNGNDDRAYAVDYTISSVDTWEFKTITIDGDTSGTWDTDNTAGMTVRFGLGVPTGGARAIAAGSWSSTSNVCGSTTAVNVLAAVNNYFQITGVCLNVGDSAIDFPYESYGDTLAKCQRYFEKYVSGWAGDGGNQQVSFRVEKRVNPTVTVTQGSAAYLRTGGFRWDRAGDSTSEGYEADAEL
jgi:hypothetical protein